MAPQMRVALGLIALASSPAWAKGSLDASTYTVHCNTIIGGKIKFAPALTSPGTATSVTGTVSASLAGCIAMPSVVGGPAVTIQSGEVSGTLSGTSNDCNVLLSPGPATGSLTVKWNATPALLEKSSVATVSALSFFFFTPGFPFSAEYGGFKLSVSGVTGSFQGPDHGASSFALGTTAQDVNTLLGACASTKGLKVINFGFGEMAVQ
jgi:hypothetical protein